MLSFSKEVMENAEAEGIKGLIGYSFEALRDEELSKKYQEDEDWN